MKEILFFLSDLDGGGAQRTIVNLFNGLFAQGYSVTLVVARSGGAAEKWIDVQVPWIDLKVTRSLYAFQGLRKEIKRIKPDILFTTMVDANILASLACVGIRHKMHLILRETNSHRARLDIGFIRRLLVKWAYHKADFVVALSSGIRDELICDYHLASKKVITIGNPIDLAKMDVQAQTRSHSIASYNSTSHNVASTPKQNARIIAIGRLHRQKGFDILIQAFAQMKHPTAHLTILGEGHEREPLLQLAKDCKVDDRLLMPGFIDDPLSWLKQADLFVLSSRWEGFGHVIAEAMAVGVPVVATDCPHGPRDIIKHEKTGVLVDAQNVTALAVALDKMLSNKKASARMAQQAKASVQRFSRDNIIKIYIDLFNSLGLHSR